MPNKYRMFLNCLSLLNIKYFADIYNFPTVWSEALSPEEFLEINCTLFNGTCIGFLNDTQLNGTSNNTFAEETGEPLADIILMGILSVLLGLMILITVIGKKDFF